MISILDKKDCCGCGACVQSCPKQCISLTEDDDGFLYPIIDISFCIDCGLCTKVCPIQCLSISREPLAVYAAKNKDEQIRLESSSGGIFTLLAEHIIEEGGVVFGARFNAKWGVIHSYTDNKEGISAFRGSKYVQSDIGNSYEIARSFLKQGRKVLFSGTPCQIAGLKLFLHKEYANLLTVDFICHGVPSPKVWKMYVREVISKNKAEGGLSSDICLNNVSFRNKNIGWRDYSLAFAFSGANGKNKLYLESLSKSTYLCGFQENLFLRPSCYSCPVKELRSNSDFTIADYWGIENVDKKFDDGKGCSAVMLNTTQALFIYNSLQAKIDCFISEYSLIKKYNHSISLSAKLHRNYSLFFKTLNQKKQAHQLIKKYSRPVLSRRLHISVIIVLKRVGLYNVMKNIKGVLIKNEFKYITFLFF